MLKLDCKRHSIFNLEAWVGQTIYRLIYIDQVLWGKKSRRTDKNIKVNCV